MILGVRIGECAEADIEEVMAIERDSFPSPWTEGILHRERANPLARIIVGRLDGEPVQPVVGYLVYWLVAGEMQLHNIAVRKDQRRMGIGFLLLRQAVLDAQRAGAKSVTLEVRSSNLAAQRLYRKFGFSVNGVRRRYYSDTGEDALVLAGALDRVLPGEACSPEGMSER